MPKNWSFLPFSNAFKQISIISKIKLKEYKTEGKFPIIDQGENFISGYWNNDDDAIKEIPLIAFGDHTRRFKFISFPFVAGADGLKLFSPLFTTPCFSYYMCLALSFPNKGYARHSSFLKKCIFPVPPLAEQERIVAKIEELFASIDAGIENLKSVKNQIALYRQSVLKSAFDFDASTFSALKNLIDKVRYGTSKKCSTEENVNSMPVYRIPNIDLKKGVLDKTDLKFASFDDSEKSSLMLKSGDILIIRSNGSLNLVGRAALVYNTDTNGLYAGYLMRLRIKDTEKLLPKFLLHFLNSGKARAYIEEKAKSTSGVNNINSEEISDLQIPVPTLAEQERIVAEIESRFERADALETAVDRALNDAEKLKQAVLKKAFRGELVPQNPDDEPASVLLDRIRAARASELPAKKGKRK